jgi:hypothetical protein
MTLTATAPVFETRKTATIFTAGALAVVALLALLEWRTAPFRAESERLMKLEVAAESKTFCEKYGMPSDAQTHKDCVADLQAIRDKHSERTNRDAAYGI